MCGFLDSKKSGRALDLQAKRAYNWGVGMRDGQRRTGDSTMLIHGVQVVEGNKVKLSYRKLGEQHATGRWGTVIDPARYGCLVLEHDTKEKKGYKHTGILPGSIIVH